MNLHKSTNYALHAALQMAMADDRPVTVAQVAALYDIPESALAKVFQQLVRSGIARGSRGVGGGYRLAIPAHELTVLQIMEVFEDFGHAGRCQLKDERADDCPEEPDCRLRGLFEEVDDVLRSTFASVTLDTLAR
ncbi:MAG: RrF2 family transcriptional regulator [Planctomycetota bacterium]